MPLLNVWVISLLLALPVGAADVTAPPAAATGASPATAAPSPFPASVTAVLAAATTGTLYSLNPAMFRSQSDGPITAADAFHNFQILGKVDLDAKQLPAVVGAFQAAAVAGEKMEGVALCFNPRHGLRVAVNGHTYDFVLCYECSRLNIYEDDQQIAAMNAVGAPKVLNDLLSAAKVPISGPSEAQIEAQDKQASDIKAKFEAQMPKSLGDLWVKNNYNWPGVPAARAALAAEIPDTSSRIRALLGYYGAGGGAWNAFGGYEVQAVNLLLDYSAEDVAAALQGPLTDAQMEGAARWLTGYKYAYLPNISAAIKAKLLAYVMKSNDDKKIALAQRLLSPPPVNGDATPSP